MTGRIIGTGSYVPERIVTNEELAEVVETSDEWIVTRTGIHERRIAETEGTPCSTGIIREMECRLPK